jgi:hypothetical protein
MRIFFRGISIIVNKMPHHVRTKSNRTKFNSLTTTSGTKVITGGGRRTRKSRGLMSSVKKFFGMTRSRRGRSRRQ